MNTTIELSEPEVEQAVKEYLERKKFKVSEVKLKVGFNHNFNGDPREPSGPYFGGATCAVELPSE